MTSYELLRPLVDGVEALFIRGLQEAEEARERETSCSTRIQRHWRGYVVRRNLETLTAQCLLIQRCYRGHVGRERARRRREDLDRDLRERYFARAATDIQRHWRGFHSRKHLLDFRQRRAFLQAVARQNRRVRLEAQSELENSLLRLATAEEAREEATTRHTLSRMHHMLSTRVRDGPLQQPLLPSVGLDATAHLGGRPVEDIIRETARSRRASVSGSPSALMLSSIFLTVTCVQLFQPQSLRPSLPYPHRSCPP
jgi:hypothetical protein